MMEHQKILNSLNEVNDSKFVTRKWNIVNDNSNTNQEENLQSKVFVSSIFFTTDAIHFHCYT